MAPELVFLVLLAVYSLHTVGTSGGMVKVLRLAPVRPFFQLTATSQ
jgi:hypothetical protein